MNIRPPGAGPAVPVDPPGSAVDPWRRALGLADLDTCVRDARQGAVRVLAGWRLSDAVCETAALVVSELVTNARRHGEPPLELVLSLFPSAYRGHTGLPGRVQIDVRDASAAMPVRREGDKDGEGGGFGLTVVTGLAELSYHPLPVGKIVRAVLALTGPDIAQVRRLAGLACPYRSGGLFPAGEPTPVSPLIGSVGGKGRTDRPPGS